MIELNKEESSTLVCVCVFVERSHVKSLLKKQSVCVRVCVQASELIIKFSAHAQCLN